MTLDGEPVTELNELECVGGQVWANVWQTDRIVRIDPATGQVTAVVDAAGLLDPAPAGRHGRAQRHRRRAGRRDEFLLTGKLWPATFRVRFVPPEAHPSGRVATAAPRSAVGQNEPRGVPSRPASAVASAPTVRR